MTADLHLADDLALPPEAVTETFCVLAKRGAGKTYCASVLVEEMIGAGLPVCVIDPVGVFWGLRSSADGEGPGLPVVIFGGDHGDLPLPETAGTIVADLLIDDPVPVVLDLSQLSKRAQRRLVCEFMERLYHRNRDPLHVVVDEADLFAPQRGGADVARLLGAYEDVVRRGRAHGLGCTSITQRPATLHKDILTQSEVLIALRMTGVRDVAAIDEWVRLHADDAEAKEVEASLAALPIGTAWVWSPGWLGILRRVQIRARKTFDSSATPKPGQHSVAPRRSADVDLERLRGRLADLADNGEDSAASSNALRAEVTKLRRELADARTARPAPKVERVEVPVLTEELRAEMREVLTALEGTSNRVVEAVGKLSAALTLAALPSPGRQPSAPAPRRPVRAEPRAVEARLPAARTADHVGLKAGARRMIEVAARQHPLRVSRAQLATLTGLKVTGGTFGTYFSEVRRRGLIAERDGLVEVTNAGLNFAGVAARSGPMTLEELRDQWFGVLKAGARTMLTQLLDAYPQTVGRGALAARTGLEPSGGTFGTYLSILRRNGLVEVDGDRVRAAEVFFLARAPGV